ncbi:MAG TPA: peptidase [Clostridium sp.]|nr:peptidase [Clostridium sp.]
MPYNPWASYWHNPWYNRLITQQHAVQIALQRIPGQVIRVEMDTENGILVYEVNIRTAYGVYEIKVNAANGAIVDIDFDND